MPPKNSLFAIFALVAFAAVPLTAAEQVLIPADTEMTDAYRQLRAQLADGRSNGWVTPRQVSASHSYLLPYYQIDRNNTWGESTLIGLRNTGGSSTQLEISYYDRAAVRVRHQVISLGPAQVVTINLRDLPELVPEGDGFARGFAVVRSGSALSADSFQVDPSQDFATGERLEHLSAEDWCVLRDTRYLNGGGFSGGTELTIVLGDPQSARTRRDSAGAVFEIFDEQGESWGVVYFFSNQAVSRLHVDEILAALPAAPEVGALEVLFMPETGGGLLYAEFRAEGRYAVSLPGSCIDGD